MVKKVQSLLISYLNLLRMYAVQHRSSWKEEFKTLITLINNRVLHVPESLPLCIFPGCLGDIIRHWVVKCQQPLV